MHNSETMFEALESRAMMSADPYAIGSSRVVLSTPDPYRAMAVADLDSDGDQDVVVSAGPRIYTLLNDGAGRFTQTSVFRVTGYATSLAIGDFNGDGIPDLAAFGYGTATSPFLRLHFGDGDGTWTKQGVLKVAGTEALVGNFDADAQREVAVVSAQKVTVYQLNTGVPKSPRVVYSTTGQIRSVAADDLNGDGLTDLAVGEQTIAPTSANPTGGKITAVQIKADATITQPVFYGEMARIDSVRIANVVGSAKPEIVYTGRAIASPASIARYSVQYAAWNDRSSSWSSGVEVYHEETLTSPTFRRDLRLILGTIGDVDGNGARDITFRRELRLDPLVNPGPTVYETYMGVLLADGVGGYQRRLSDQGSQGERRPAYSVVNVDNGSTLDLLYMVLDTTAGGKNKLRLAQGVLTPLVV